jgi:hypothetical protein
MLRSMPSNLAAWDDYFEVYRPVRELEPPDFAEANAHYLANRAASWTTGPRRVGRSGWGSRTSRPSSTP